MPNTVEEAWTALLRAFPGNFPPAVFYALPLDDMADVFDMAITYLEAEAAAITAARNT